jgi:hemin uptake protein HemP
MKNDDESSRRNAVGSHTPTPLSDEIDVHSIMHGRQEIVLLHNGNRYRLRITSNKKLILTK